MGGDACLPLLTQLLLRAWPSGLGLWLGGCPQWGQVSGCPFLPLSGKGPVGSSFLVGGQEEGCSGQGVQQRHQHMGWCSLGHTAPSLPQSNREDVYR